MKLKEKVKDLPSSPGVYLMKDSLNTIIYVGKAKNLKNRVRSYFQNSRAHSQKVKKLKANIHNFDYILTDTEFEALLLECQLIRELKPVFNRRMKNPNSYTYIKFYKVKEVWNIVLSNTLEENDYLYFGPYTSKHIVEKALKGLMDIFKLNCSNPNKGTPCLNYALGSCIGICFNEGSRKKYNENIQKMMDLLKGANTLVLKEFKQKMQQAAANFDFETAAKYRDTLEAVHALINKEKVIEFTEANKNIALIEHISDSTIKLFLIQGNHVLFSEKFNKDGTDFHQLVKLIKTKIQMHFKINESPVSIGISKEEIDEAQIIYSYLNSASCNYVIIPENWLEIDQTTIILNLFK
jgi:excinuclease ABC subunit C